MHENNRVSKQPDPSFLTFEVFFTNGYVLAVLAFLAILLQATLTWNHWFLSIREGARCKTAIQVATKITHSFSIASYASTQALVYDKSLRLSPFAFNEGKMTTGQVMNHMSVDPLSVFFFFYWMHDVWTMPVQVCVNTYKNCPV
jgi:ATP-binding cassette subfamily C (CFTR/MRP) protein 8/ATP-binding cassette subfamily C (CFTR/MRP) protein 9